MPFEGGCCRRPHSAGLDLAALDILEWMDYEEAFQLIVTGVRDGLHAIAARNHAEFVDASSGPKAPEAPPFVFRLVPPSTGGAPVEVMPDNADSTYISVGQGGWIEVFTSPRDPEKGVSEVLKIVEAVAAGRLKERIWKRKRTGERVNSLLHIQYSPDGPWRLIGEVSRPLPLVRTVLYDEESIDYAPYSA